MLTQHYNRTMPRVIEKYGPYRIGYGNYPVDERYDVGGDCEGCGVPPFAAQASQEMQERGAYYKHRMEQRGGNNPIYDISTSDYQHYNIGVGCSNPACNCPNCHYDCKCDSDGNLLVPNGAPAAMTMGGGAPQGMSLLHWALIAFVAYYLFKRFLK